MFKLNLLLLLRPQMIKKRLIQFKKLAREFEIWAITAIVLLSTNHVTAQDTYPLDMSSDTTFYNRDLAIYLSGGAHHPKFIVWCLNSEFGPAYQLDSTSSTAISATWVVNRAAIHEQAFTLKLSTYDEEYLSYSDMELHPSIGIRIDIFDQQGKQLKRDKNLLFNLLTSFKKLFFERVFIATTSLGVYSMPSQSAKEIFQISKGEKVIVKVNQSNTKSGWVEAWIGDGVSGFIKRSGLVSMSEITPEDIKTVKESIKPHAKLRIIRNSTYKRAKAIRVDFDITNVAIPIVIRQSDYEPEMNLKSFYLPINNGQDSAIFVDRFADNIGTRFAYVGRVREVNKYLVGWYSQDGNGYQLVDPNSGMVENISNGFPLFSPDLKFMIDYYVYEEYSEGIANSPPPQFRLSLKRKKGHGQYDTVFRFLSLQLSFGELKWISKKKLMGSIIKQGGARPQKQYFRLTVEE
jgi:hypothetical protein